jgi:hypothetical protein
MGKVSSLLCLEQAASTVSVGGSPAGVNARGAETAQLALTKSRQMSHSIETSPKRTQNVDEHAGRGGTAAKLLTAKPKPLKTHSVSTGA